VTDVFTVTGFTDEENGELYVSAVFRGRQEPVDSLKSAVRVDYYGRLTQFLGYFEADSGGEAELIAVDVVRHYDGDQTARWATGPGKPVRRVETVRTDKL
jgi:hypothetical protein